jgi:DNA-binding transcriptional LysR family regulator
VKFVIDVRRLTLLRELAIRGTVAATAGAMHLTGPAVSQQLAVLEREAGVALLEKRGRTLALTAAGRLLVAHAEIVIGDLATAEAELAALRGGRLGTVRVASFPSAARVLVARLWERDGTWPSAALDLRLVEQEPERSVQSLLARDVDVAVVHAYSLLPRDLPDCDRIPLLDDPVLLALHPDDAAERGLEPGAPARLADFAGMRWLVPAPETSCHEMTQRACGAAGFVMTATAHATDFSVLAAMVGAGAGAALMPQLALPASAEGTAPLSLHPLRQPVTRTISALARSGESGRPEIGRVLDGLQRAAREYDLRAGRLPQPHVFRGSPL